MQARKGKCSRKEHPVRYQQQPQGSPALTLDRSQSRSEPWFSPQQNEAEALPPLTQHPTPDFCRRQMDSSLPPAAASGFSSAAGKQEGQEGAAEGKRRKLPWAGLGWAGEACPHPRTPN